jgi:hypothetical protein
LKNRFLYQLSSFIAPSRTAPTFAKTSREDLNRFGRPVDLSDSWFSEHSWSFGETACVLLDQDRGHEAVQRRDFLKFSAGWVASAAALATSAQAAPMLPIPAESAPRRTAANVQPAVASQDDVDHLKPEPVHWHHHWRRHWRHHWHRRWHHRHWHHRHW